MTSTMPEPTSSYQTRKTLAIVGVIGIVLIACLLVYGVIVYPSKQPYRDALAQYDNVGRANATLTAAGSSLDAGNATNEQFEKNIKTAQDALTSLKKENEALGKVAVLQDGKGKELYDAFNAKLQPYMEYNEAILSSMLKVRPVIHECSQDMTSLTEDAASIKAVRACVAKLQALKGIADKDYQQLVESFSESYTQLANILESHAPDAERSQIVEDLSAASSDFTKNTQEHRRVLLTTDASQNLKDFLVDRSNIF